MRFNGPDYEPENDKARLSKQHVRIRELMRDGKWRTLNEIADVTCDPPASISAQLRHLRKQRFGSWIVKKRRRGDRKHGLYEYRLRAPTDVEIQAVKKKRQRRRRLKKENRALKKWMRHAGYDVEACLKQVRNGECDDIRQRGT